MHSRRWTALVSRIFIASGVAVAIAVNAGCLLPPRDQADGSSCGDDNECSSHGCFQGYCGGSSCESNRSRCEPGWKCIHSVSGIEEFFEEDLGFGTGGAEGDWTCTALCGHCPGNSHCPPGGKDDETPCHFGKGPLVVSVAPVSGKLGEPVRLVATAPTPIASCNWSFGDGESETVQGAEATHTYEVGAPTIRTSVSCTDIEGRSGSAEIKVELACRGAGDSCGERQCCTTGSICADGPSPTGKVCRAPRAPVVTVAGPTTAKVSTTVSFTASATSDTGLSRVEWTWGDGSSETVGLSRERTHRYSKAGSFVVRVKVSDANGQGEGETPIEITP